jgi:hypothetical protein
MGISLKTFFVVTKDINHTIILGTPFIDMITPCQAHHDCIVLLPKLMASNLSFHS